MSKPYLVNGVLIGQGASLDPKALTPGTTGQVLTGTTGGPPAFAAPAVVDLTTGVTGVLPRANGGTQQAVGAFAIMQCIGVAVLLGSTVYLGRTSDATEANVRWRCPVTGTVTAIYGTATAAPGGTDTFIYRLFIAGSIATGTFTVTGAATDGSVAGISTAVTAGDFLSVRLITSATAATASHQVTLAIRVDA